MDYIKNHNDFINEISRNEPIPELYEDNIALFLIGPPASGKSTMRQKILSKNQSFNIIDPDDTSRTLLSQKHKLKKMSSRISKGGNRVRGIQKELTQKFIFNLDAGNNVIYDSTGNSKDLLSELISESKKYGYKVLFIHMLPETLEDAIKMSDFRHKLIGRNVDEDYLVKTYEETNELKNFYEPMADEYYVVHNRIDRPSKYYKFIDGRVHKKRAMKWVDIDKKPVLESVQTEMHAFDMDGTLIDSPHFYEFYINGLPDPSSDIGKIIDTELEREGVTRDEIIIKNHRIMIPAEKAKNWRVIGDMAHMSKLNDYYQTPESLGDDVFDSIKNIMDSKENISIITGRSNKLEIPVKEHLRKLGIKIPEQLHLAPDPNTIPEWKSSILKEMLNTYSKVFYYEDKKNWIDEIRSNVMDENLVIYHVEKGKIIGEY